MEREGLSIMVSCSGRSVSRNSVFEGLSIRRFGDIQGETSAFVFSRKETSLRNFIEEKEMKS
jgi:hypothetical protein